MTDADPNTPEPSPVPPPPAAAPGPEAGSQPPWPPPYPTAPPAGYAQMPPPGSPYAVGPMMTPGGLGPPPKNNQGLAITAIVLGLFFAGLVGAALGIVAIVKANQVSTKWAAGDFAGAEKAAKAAKTWAIITIVLSPIFAVVVFFALLSLDAGLQPYVVLPAP